METKFNFNSQVATNRQQSERLLALGLKKETADMCHRTNGMGIYFVTAINPLHNPCDIPAWSLHRLVSLCNTDNIKIALNEKDCWGGNILKISHRKAFEKDNLYDNLCGCIEWLIKEGYFNKEYLV